MFNKTQRTVEVRGLEVVEAYIMLVAKAQPQCFAGTYRCMDITRHGKSFVCRRERTSCMPTLQPFCLIDVCVDNGEADALCIEACVLVCDVQFS